jgi:hypothetical protein
MELATALWVQKHGAETPDSIIVCLFVAGAIPLLIAAIRYERFLKAGGKLKQQIATHPLSFILLCFLLLIVSSSIVVTLVQHFHAHVAATASVPPTPATIPSPIPQNQPQQTAPKDAAPTKERAKPPKTQSATQPTQVTSTRSPGSVVQNNSGGVNVQQGTTGDNSPIINSPITVGSIPRSLDPDQGAKFAHALGPNPAGFMGIACLLGDNEGCDYADQIRKEIALDQWDHSGGLSRVVYTGSPQGVIVVIAQGEDANPPMGAIQLMRAFEFAGIKAQGEMLPSAKKGTFYLLIGDQPKEKENKK